MRSKSMIILALASVISFGSMAFAQSPDTTATTNKGATSRNTEKREERREEKRGERREKRGDEAREGRRHHRRSGRHMAKKTEMKSKASMNSRK